jgi:hypothetical protein
MFHVKRVPVRTDTENSRQTNIKRAGRLRAWVEVSLRCLGERSRLLGAWVRGGLERGWVRGLGWRRPAAGAVG